MTKITTKHLIYELKNLCSSRENMSTTYIPKQDDDSFAVSVE